MGLGRWRVGFEVGALVIAYTARFEGAGGLEVLELEEYPAVGLLV